MKGIGGTLYDYFFNSVHYGLNLLDFGRLTSELFQYLHSFFHLPK